MAFIYEILPVFLFFAAFKFKGIYVATVVGIVATFLQMMVHRFLKDQWDKKQVITFGVFLLFGGMTLYFHNPIFVKWKPTIIFWLFALILLFSHFFSNKPLTQRMIEASLENNSRVPTRAWRHINLLWTVFFAGMGGLNLWVAYQYTNDTWVNFKFYGLTSALILMSVIQAIYLMRYLKNE